MLAGAVDAVCAGCRLAKVDADGRSGGLLGGADRSKSPATRVAAMTQMGLRPARWLAGAGAGGVRRSDP